MKLLTNIFILTWLSFLMGFTYVQVAPNIEFQSDEKVDTTPKKKKYTAVKIPQSFVDSLNAAQAESEQKFAKYDSLLDARDKTIDKMSGSVNSIQQSNVVLKKAAQRFIDAFERYKQDPVGYKLDIDWSDIDTLRDEKKSPNYPVVDPEKAKPIKRTWFNSIFGKKKPKD